MSSIISYLRADEPTSRETRIFTCGVILIAIGGAFALLTLSIAYGLAVGALLGSRFGIVPPGRGPGSTLVLLTPILLFSVSAVVFIWTGIGSVQMRRWCRPIIMSLSALAVAGGLLFLINLALQSWFIPDLSTTTPAVRRRGAGAAGAGATTSGEMILFLSTYAVLGIVVPLVFFAAYRDRQVERTLDEADPRLYWTDRCPIPVLAFALFMIQLAYVLILLLPVVMIAPNTPVFGFPLDPAPACGVFLLTAALCVVAAHLTHKQSPAGPWLAIGIAAAVGASIITSTVAEPPAPPPSPYQRYAAPPQPLSDHIIPGVILTVAVYTIPVILFALWVLRLLRPPPQPRQPAKAPPRATVLDMPVPPLPLEPPPLATEQSLRDEPAPPIIESQPILR